MLSYLVGSINSPKFSGGETQGHDVLIQYRQSRPLLNFRAFWGLAYRRLHPIAVWVLMVFLVHGRHFRVEEA
jgi:hypothetical protein